MKLEPCIIIKLFLNFSDSEPQYSYKLYSNKKVRNLWRDKNAEKDKKKQKILECEVFSEENKATFLNFLGHIKYYLYVCMQLCMCTNKHTYIQYLPKVLGHFAYF